MLKKWMKKRHVQIRRTRFKHTHTQWIVGTNGVALEAKRQRCHFYPPAKKEKKKTHSQTNCHKNNSIIITANSEGNPTNTEGNKQRRRGDDSEINQVLISEQECAADERCKGIVHLSENHSTVQLMSRGRWDRTAVSLINKHAAGT